MNSKLVAWWASIRESYWFIPSLMALGAIVLSFLTTGIDGAIGSEWLENVSWLYANKPAGARSVLSTVAGSMITVAGVTFSMTILSISYTTGQVGPRLLKNFMRDIGNQITLGVFISTFLYCLMVLRTVRNADTAPVGGVSSDAEMAAAFVPHLAILVGLLMAIASVGVLIFFVHHIPESIHVSNIVAGVGRDLNARIEKQFPSQIGVPMSESGKSGVSHSTRSTELQQGIQPQRQTKSTADSAIDLPDSFYNTAKGIICPGAGYIEFMDTDGLMGIAQEQDLILRLKFRPGDFVTRADTLMFAGPAKRVDEEIESRLVSSLVWGSQRTANQNLRFVMNQLVEVAIRALSPGVNDPFTAMNCMDWLRSGLQNLAHRELPSPFRYDDDGNLRVVAEPESFEAFLSLVCDQLRPYVATDRNAAVHMMEMLAIISLHIEEKTLSRMVIRHACALRRECRSRMNDLRGIKLLTTRYRTMIRMHYDPDYRQKAVRTGHWIGGRA